jgi:hypothetical protein
VGEKEGGKVGIAIFDPILDYDSPRNADELNDEVQPHLERLGSNQRIEPRLFFSFPQSVQAS